MASSRYRLLSPGGAELESGSGAAEVTGDALLIKPDSSRQEAVLAIPFGRISAISEPQPYSVAVTLTDGHVVELSRLGVMRTQLLAELRDARAACAAQAAGAVGKAETYSGYVAGSPADVRIYEDALLIASDGGTRRIGFSFVTAVQRRDYEVMITLADDTSAVVSRLGNRTSELAGLLDDRLREARTRTASFLGSLLPALDPMSQRSAAALLRDGVAVPAHSLDAIHPELSATLLRVATRPGRFPAVAALARHADIAIGFKQAASVRVAAAGGSAWRDSARRTHVNEHEAPDGLLRPGLAGQLAGEFLSDLGPGGPGPGTGYGGPFGGGYERFGGLGGLGPYWAYSALRAGINWTYRAEPNRPMTPRADVRRGTLTPPSEDLAALTTAGLEPTVLAFALFASSRGRVAFEVLNLPAATTYVYEADGDARAVINRALDDAGFGADAIHAARDGALTVAVRTDDPAVLLASSLVAAVPHGPDWQRQIAGLLSRS